MKRSALAGLIFADETQAHEDSIRSLTQSAFLGLEHSSNTEHKIVDELRRAKALTLSIVAMLPKEDTTQIVAHVAISPVELSDGTKNWFGLGPISVLPDLQFKGIGSALMLEVLQRLKKSGADGCVLLGDPGYYCRFGFEVVPGLTYAGAPAPYFQALSFDGCYPQASVEYHRAFNLT